MTAMIIHLFILSSAVQTSEFSYIPFHCKSSGRKLSLNLYSSIVSFVKFRALFLCPKNGMQLMGRECLDGRTDNFSVANKDWFVIN